MSSYNLDYTFDENLQEVPANPLNISAYVDFQIENLKVISSPIEQAKIMSEIGAYLRILRRLDQAEKYLLEAGKLIISYSLPQSTLLAQQIRLAHVYQWQKNFNASNALFNKILKQTETTANLGALKDFTWQHAGKNYFDQGDFKNALAAFEKALELRKLRNAPDDQIASSRQSIDRTKNLIRL